jgi:hypothetical protein
MLKHFTFVFHEIDPHQWNSHSTCILQWILSSWSTHLSGSFPKV